MRNPAYDLFRGTSRGNGVWIGAEEGLQAAADRMSCLVLSAPDDYFLFHAGDIVASASSPNARQRETPWTIVIVSSDSNHIDMLTDILKKQELKPVHISTVSQYRELLSRQQIGLVFCDPNLADGEYRDVINASRSTGSEARVVVTFRLSSGTGFLEAMRDGAFDVVSKPCRSKEVEWMVIQAKRDARKTAKQLMISNVKSRTRDAS